MINYLTGICQNQLESNQYLIMAGSIGFGVRANLPLKVGQKVALYVHEHIREDIYDLYGFSSLEELVIFRQLIAVSGIGPKMALNILKQGSIADLLQAISDSNVNYFQNVSGVGKKLAQKIIIELKGKINQESDLAELLDDRLTDLKEALTSLGYKPFEYNKILTNLPKELKTIQEQLTWALKQLRY